MSHSQIIYETHHVTISLYFYGSKQENSLYHYVYLYRSQVVFAALDRVEPSTNRPLRHRSVMYALLNSQKRFMSIVLYNSKHRDNKIHAIFYAKFKEVSIYTMKNEHKFMQKLKMALCFCQCYYFHFILMLRRVIFLEFNFTFIDVHLVECMYLHKLILIRYIGMI